MDHGSRLLSSPQRPPLILLYSTHSSAICLLHPSRTCSSVTDLVQPNSSAHVPHDRSKSRYAHTSLLCHIPQAIRYFLRPNPTRHREVIHGHNTPEMKCRGPYPGKRRCSWEPTRHIPNSGTFPRRTRGRPSQRGKAFRVQAARRTSPSSELTQVWVSSLLNIRNDALVASLASAGPRPS